VRSHPYSKGWHYVSMFGWQPFARFGAGGWIMLDRRWLREHWNAGKVRWYVDPHA
jgi:hypothetical protein